MSERDETIKYTADVVLCDDQGRVLLVQRKYEPFQGMWALPGGHVNAGEVSVSAARRELTEETGMDVPEDSLSLVTVVDAPDRDTRGRYVSVVYFAMAAPDAEPVAGDDAADVRFWTVEDMPKLAFDHSEIIGEFARVTGLLLR